MPGLVPGIHVFPFVSAKYVDGRDKPGHDGEYVAQVIRCNPASMRTSSPVMLLDCGVARKHTRAAISSALAATLSGTFDTTISRTCLAPPPPRPFVNHGVSI